MSHIIAAMGKIEVRPEVVRETYGMVLADTPRCALAHFAALKRILDREQPDYAR